MVNIGYAHDGLIGSVQTQLRRAQEEIGFTYLRFHGILDDDMHIYQEHADGSPWFNFAYADLLFDFIQEIGLIPYVELSYIPSKLAKGDAALFDNRNIHITMYNDPEKWQALIQACLSHWIDKYGLNVVRRWKFTAFSMNYTEMTDPPLCSRLPHAKDHRSGAAAWRRRLLPEHCAGGKRPAAFPAGDAAVRLHAGFHHAAVLSA